MNGLESVAEGKQERARLLGLRPGARAIDVGCGLGDDARALSRLVGQHGEVVGLDSSTALLERAQARCETEDGPVTFVAGDAHDLPFEAGIFDAARTERTLQHLEDPARVVGELAQVTRPGGVVLADSERCREIALFAQRGSASRGGLTPTRSAISSHFQ